MVKMFISLFDSFCDRKGQTHSAQAKSKFYGNIPCKTFVVSHWPLLFGHNSTLEILRGRKIQQNSSMTYHGASKDDKLEKYYFIKGVRPKSWVSTCWSIEFVKSGVSLNQWFSMDLTKSINLGISSASWSCLCVQLPCGWHQAGCQACPLQQSVTTWPQLFSIISSTWLLCENYYSECTSIPAFTCILKPLFSLPHRGRKST